MKNIFTMTIAVAFVFSLFSLALAETVTKIAGNKITLMDNTGKLKTIETHSKGIKVGDKVTVMTRDGQTLLRPQLEPPTPSVEGQDRSLDVGKPIGSGLGSAAGSAIGL